MASPSPQRRRSGDLLVGWTRLFQEAKEAIFLLNRRRRIRFVNRSWEQLTGQSADQVLGLFCLSRKRKGIPTLQSLAQTLAPPPEVLEGQSTTIRRAIPPGKVGPPWWDITFLPLTDPKGLVGIIGKIVRSGETASTSTPTGKGVTEGLIAVRQQMVNYYPFDLLASTLPAMDRIASQTRAASQSMAPVWIIGKPGTGKQTLARIVHYQGLTRERHFVSVDGAGLQPFLIRNMLFGENGFAESNKLGTLYFHHPESMPTDLQAEILDWYIEQEKPPRIIIATEEHPRQAILNNQILADLFAVWGVLEIHLPQLQERKEDLPRLIGRFGERIANPFPGIASGAMELFQGYDWPENLKELYATLLESSQRADGKVIDIHHLPLAMREKVRIAKGASPRPNSSESSLLLAPILERVEKKMIQLALERAHNNKTEAADLLGLTRTQLWRKLKDLGLEKNDE